MLMLIGIKACDSMKKAVVRLDASTTAYGFRDLKKQPPSHHEVLRWYALVGEPLLNKRGTSWRKLDAAAQATAHSAEGIAELIVSNPSLIKRPLLDDGKYASVGLDSPLLP
jgi:Spx/MgsR family transcriptional regulator